MTDLQVWSPQIDPQTQYRVGLYRRFVEETSLGSVMEPNLQAFVDWMDGQQYAVTSIQSISSTVRNEIWDKLNDKQVQDYIEAQLEAQAPGQGAAKLRNHLELIRHKLARVKLPKAIIQDRPDDGHIRLTVEESIRWLESIDPERNIIRARDMALLILMLITGARSQEALGARVEDIHQKKDGREVFLIPAKTGKGNKQRIVPYGAAEPMLKWIDRYIEMTGIKSGRFFQSYFKGDKVRGFLSYDGLSKVIMPAYAAWHNGEMVQLEAHDLRRTYARQQYLAGMPVVEIQQNLGHSKMETTLLYIGALSTSARSGLVSFGGLDGVHSDN